MLPLRVLRRNNRRRGHLSRRRRRYRDRASRARCTTAPAQSGSAHRASSPRHAVHPISSASHAASSTSPSDRQLPRRGAAMPSRKQRAPPPATAPPRTAERTEERNTSSSEQRSAAEATHTAEAPGGHSASNSASRSVGASAVPRRRTNVRGGVGPRAAVELGAGTARHRRPPAVARLAGVRVRARPRAASSRCAPPTLRRTVDAAVCALGALLCLEPRRAGAAVGAARRGCGHERCARTTRV